MIVVLKNGAEKQKIEELKKNLNEKGLEIHESKGKDVTLWGLVGDTSRITPEELLANDIVESAQRVKAPYKQASRSFHPEDTVIDVKGNKIGDGKICSIMAGPCSVETEEQIIEVAKAVKASGARFLRGGAFKPRTSPYSFQGLGAEGLELLKIARKETGLPIVTELMAINQIPLFEDVDIIQIGARNMQNFDLLKEVGKLKNPILLKRGLSATVKEFLMSAEYIMASGNENVILCERGIRTFDNYTRNCLDLSIVPYLKKETHLPVIIDPSHACGIRWMVPTLAKAAVAVGADGLIIEVHNNPEKALCDGEQSLTPAQFDDLMKVLGKYAAVEGRTV
ncbi:3-deoxy-7-phosphoheptulonate synthase [Treponema ruminis]|uniref:3-deoxy-7-phosphoheptulonate synthase n=1 Tax=Treponema ruminis TaxID=744515 RepID=A0A7W8G9X6_9SPIR|nr:3-deoxy-7-phosphoheptulonate synthase [Treponema ruminis]MBB5226465.1 3-deoxy-7-phosphoheptulonate synthase [Treponema ruminis]QSI02630.1 3-deoxy-7-phosphoheptulonate synthase [Treponema ruminis]